MKKCPSCGAVAVDADKVCIKCKALFPGRVPSSPSGPKAQTDTRLRAVASRPPGPAAPASRGTGEAQRKRVNGRLLWLILAGLGVLVIICGIVNKGSVSVPNQITLTAEPTRDASNGVVINGTTNLPDGTKLGIELMNGGKPAAQDFDVLVTSGRFHSAGFRNGGSPIVPGKRTVHILTYFTTSWQSQEILDLVGAGGSKLKTSSVIRAEDSQLVDADKVLDYTADMTFPPLNGSTTGAEAASPPPGAGATPEARALETVKRAVLVVDGRRSSMNVEDGVNWYCNSPGTRMGDGWSTTRVGGNTYSVVVDFIDSDGRGNEWHAKAMWEVNLDTGNVMYRNKYAKGFSWVPDY